MTFHYEGMFILHNRELPAEEAAVTPEDFVKAMVEKVGGEVVHIVPWANRKLAYAVRGNQTGNYLLTYFSGDEELNIRLQREVRISDRCLRLLALSVPELPSESSLPGPLAEQTKATTEEDEKARGEMSVEDRKARAREEKAEAERLDYKNVHHLRRMITSQGKLFSRVRSGLDAKRQRRLRRAVMRARTIALLPFVGR